MTSELLRLEREIIHLTPDTRRYYPDRALTAQNMINWDRSGIGPTEEIPLEDTDIDLGVKVLAIQGVLGIVVWPGCMQARVADPAAWGEIEPELAAVITVHTHAPGYEIAQSPQQITS